MSLGSLFKAVSELARVALAAGVLVFAPLAEAAVCLAEDAGVSGEASISLNTPVDQETEVTDRQHDNERSSDDGQCAHGHCHHAVAFVNADEGESHRFDVRAQRLSHKDAAPAPCVSVGLERPPKA